MMNNLATKMTTTKAPPMNETKITARNVQVYYGEKHAIKDVNIDIRPRSSPPSSARRAAASRPSCAASTA